MAAAYDEELATLYLHFQSNRDDLAGPWYQYQYVGPSTVCCLLFADSAGEYLNREIKPSTTAKKLTLARVQELRFHV